MDKILSEISAEREAQIAKWGGAEHDDGHGPNDWIGFIRKHARKSWGKTPPPCGCRAVGECTHPSVATGDLTVFRKQMIRVAALAIAAIEACDRATKVN